MSFVGVTFDPRRDQLRHLGTLIELISKLFVELCVAYLRHAFHLCANLSEDGKNLLVHLCRDRSLDDIHERSGKWRHRYRRQPALRLRGQRAAQSLSFLLETRDCFRVLLVGFYQLKGEDERLARKRAMGGMTEAKRAKRGFAAYLGEQLLIRGFFLLEEIIVAPEFVQPRDEICHLLRKL